jgi:hypothetical protein
MSQEGHYATRHITLLKSSCQKPLSQLNCDFAGMIIGWSCTKLVNRLPIGKANGRTLTHDKSSHGLWPGELIKKTHLFINIVYSKICREKIALHFN